MPGGRPSRPRAGRWFLLQDRGPESAEVRTRLEGVSNHARQNSSLSPKGFRPSRMARVMRESSITSHSPGTASPPATAGRVPAWQVLTDEPGMDQVTRRLRRRPGDKISSGHLGYADAAGLCVPGRGSPSIRACPFVGQIARWAGQGFRDRCFPRSPWPDRTICCGCVKLARPGHATAVPRCVSIVADLRQDKEQS